jgi:hypothetical protein
MKNFYLKRGVLLLALWSCSLIVTAQASLLPKEVNKLMLWRVLSLKINYPLHLYATNADKEASKNLAQGFAEKLHKKSAEIKDSSLQSLLSQHKVEAGQKLQQEGSEFGQKVKDEVDPLNRVDVPLDKASEVKEEVVALKAEPAAAIEKKAEGLLEDKLPDTKEIELPAKDPSKELQQVYEREVKQDVISSLPKEKAEKLQQRITSAQQVISKYKSSYESISSIKDLPKLKINSLKGHPLKERLLPSLFMQIVRQRQLSLDLSPYLGYALNKQMLIGAGAMYRISFQPASKKVYMNAFAYGPKLFWAYKPYKEFWLRLEGEWLQVNTTHELYKAQHVPVAIKPQMLLGLGKAFQVHKKLKGELQCLYAPFKQTTVFYPTKIQVRLGFYPVKSW